ncbi:hypothetical protein F5X98DRAFT_367905 [Xylaria grammica]|nr:hypothetical protein F5X98DRAFT_367905 [Xylaria grammica]
MTNPAIPAYVAFAYMLVITAVGMLFAYRLFSQRQCSSWEFFRYPIQIYHHWIFSILFFAYITIGIVLLALTTIHAHTWAGWCWRWSIVGAASLDSFCAIKSAKEQAKYQPAVVLQFVIASIETLLVIVSPTIPILLVTRYLTFAAIFCHAVWTSISAAFWMPSRTRIIRLAVSFGQGLGAVAMIWTPLGFVIIFCSCSIVFYAEELNKSRQPILPISSGPIRTNFHSTKESRRKYKIVFFGNGPERVQTLSRALDWPRKRGEAGGLATYDHPTRYDTTLLSVDPKIESEKDGSDYMRTLINGATAVVLVFDICDVESFEYIRGLKGFPPGQSGLLVGFRHFGEGFVVSEKDVRSLANQHGWDFAMFEDIVGAFEGLVSKMTAKPHPTGRPGFLP